MDRFNGIQEYHPFKRRFLFPVEFITKFNLFGEMADFFNVTGKTIGVWMKKLMEYGLVRRERHGFLDVSKIYVADLDEIIEGTETNE